MMLWRSYEEVIVGLMKRKIWWKKLWFFVDLSFDIYLLFSIIIDINWTLTCNCDI